MIYRRLHTSADLVRYAQSLERQGIKPDYSQMRGEWEAAQARKFWTRFDLVAALVIASCLLLSLTTATLWAGAVLFGGIYFYMDLTKRIYL